LKTKLPKKPGYFVMHVKKKIGDSEVCVNYGNREWFGLFYWSPLVTDNKTAIMNECNFLYSIIN